MRCTRQQAAYLAKLQALTACKASLQLHFDEEQGGPPDLHALLAPFQGEKTHFYACGPGPMLTAFESVCAALGQRHVHLERFAAAPQPHAAPAGSFVVELRRSGREVIVGAQQSLLAALQDAGLDPVYSCGDGVCGACEVAVLGGEVDHRDSLLSETERQGNKTMMVCVSRGKTERLVLDL
jgi:ferredoxin